MRAQVVHLKWDPSRQIVESWMWNFAAFWRSLWLCGDKKNTKNVFQNFKSFWLHPIAGRWAGQYISFLDFDRKIRKIRLATVMQFPCLNCDWISQFLFFVLALIWCALTHWLSYIAAPVYSVVGVSVLEMINSIASYPHPPNHGYHFNLSARYLKFDMKLSHLILFDKDWSGFCGCGFLWWI